MEQLWTVKTILEWIEGYLTEKGIENPRLSAQWLVADVLGVSRIELYTMFDRPLSAGEREQLRDYTRRRGMGEPLQYITGTTDFRFTTLAIEPGVLIPRPETEVLVSEALAELTHVFLQDDTEALLAVDLCTGSGNIACSLAQELPAISVFATDISPAACSLARRNVESLGLESRVLVQEGDLGEALPRDMYGNVHLVISNPPYIPREEVAQLGKEVKDFEPALALDGGHDGLDVFRRILTFARDALRPNGILAVELHEARLDAAAALASQSGFCKVRIAKDLAQKPRVLIAYQGEESL